MRNLQMIFFVFLVGCADNGVKNIDYFLIGEFDTRQSQNEFVRKLAESELNSDPYSEEWSVVRGKDERGNAVYAVFRHDRIVKMSIELPISIRSQYSINLRAIEARYGFDKMRRDDIGECSDQMCVISKYNCDNSIIGESDDMCSVYLISSRIATNWKTRIIWSDIKLYRSITDKHLNEFTKNLP